MGQRSTHSLDRPSVAQAVSKALELNDAPGRLIRV